MSISLTAGNIIAIVIGSASIAFNFYNFNRIRKSENRSKLLEIFRDQFFVRCSEIFHDVKDYERWIDVASHNKTIGADDRQARSKFISVKRDLDSFVNRALKDKNLSQIVPSADIDKYIDEIADHLNGLADVESISNQEKIYQNIAINAHELRNVLFDSVLAAKKNILR